MKTVTLNDLPDINVKAPRSAYVIKPAASDSSIQTAFERLMGMGLKSVEMSSVYDVIITCDLSCLDFESQSAPKRFVDAHMLSKQDVGVLGSIPGSASVTRPGAKHTALRDPAAHPVCMGSRSESHTAVISQEFGRMNSSTQLVSLNSKCESVDSVDAAARGEEGIPSVDAKRSYRHNLDQKDFQNSIVLPQKRTLNSDKKEENDEEIQARTENPIKRTRRAPGSLSEKPIFSSFHTTKAVPFPTKDLGQHAQRADGNDTGTANTAQVNLPAEKKQDSIQLKSCLEPPFPRSDVLQQSKLAENPPMPTIDHAEPALLDAHIEDADFSGHATDLAEAIPRKSCLVEPVSEMAVEGEWKSCQSQNVPTRMSSPLYFIYFLHLILDHSGVIGFDKFRAEDPAVGIFQIPTRREASQTQTEEAGVLNVKRFRGKGATVPTQTRGTVSFEVYQGDKVGAIMA